MIETVYDIPISKEETRNAVFEDETLHLVHMVIAPGDGMPVHNVRYDICMVVTNGTLSIDLEDNGFNDHEARKVVRIPFGTKMDARNRGKEPLELLIFKTPAKS